MGAICLGSGGGWDVEGSCGVCVLRGTRVTAAAAGTSGTASAPARRGRRSRCWGPGSWIPSRWSVWSTPASLRSVTSWAWLPGAHATHSPARLLALPGSPSISQLRKWCVSRGPPTVQSALSHSPMACCLDHQEHCLAKSTAHCLDNACRRACSWVLFRSAARQYPSYYHYTPSSSSRYFLESLPRHSRASTRLRRADTRTCESSHWRAAAGVVAGRRC